VKFDQKKIKVWAGIFGAGLITGLVIVSSCIPTTIKEVQTEDKESRRLLKEERQQHAETRQERNRYKREAEAKSEIEEVEEPVILPSGLLALDGFGAPVFKKVRRAKSSSSSSSSGSTELQASLVAATATITNLQEQITRITKKTERPAVRPWTHLFDYEVTTLRAWFGVGFNQDLRIFEAGFTVANPVPISLPPEFRPRVGITIKTHKLFGLF